MFSKMSLIAFLAASASAAAVLADPAPYAWHLTGATSTCTAATCSYSFNVSAPVGPNGQPPFTATGCYGTSVQGEYKSCATVGMDVPGDVLVQEFNFGIVSGAILSMQYRFQQGEVTYTYTGNNTIRHGDAPANFDIVPTVVFAIA